MSRRVKRLLKRQLVQLSRPRKDRRTPVPPKRLKLGTKGLQRWMNSVYVKAKHRGKTHIYMQKFRGIRLPW